jgi:16S rRNA (uracil1498-N3)-methyltransferase
MRTHRFYAHTIDLTHSFWLHDARLLHQWTKVLRFAPGQHVVLFDGAEHERLYAITAFEKDGAKLELVTDYERQLPRRSVHLLWSLLKNDHNDLLLEKATELGVSHFIPVIAERCVKQGFNSERAGKIVIEASEQCGRSDMPTVHEPLPLADALGMYVHSVPLYVAHMGGDQPGELGGSEGPVGVFIGPEGGWTDTEINRFDDAGVRRVSLSHFVLRAETAAITAAVLFA